MKILVKYTVFCPDNYQGGSGENLTFRKFFTFEDSLKVADLVKCIHSKIKEESLNVSHGWVDYNYKIISMEVFL